MSLILIGTRYETVSFVLLILISTSRQALSTLKKEKISEITQSKIFACIFIFEFITITSVLLQIILLMSLFVGNVSKKVTQKQFQDAFKAYGPCKVDLRKRFAFVQYDNQRNAEEAKKDLQNKNFCGLRLNIQWSKNSGRFNQNSKADQKLNGRKRSRSRDRSWRRGEDKWHRRSPSYEKRSSPTYSENQDIDFDTYEPKCPRDRQLLKTLAQRREKKRHQQLQRKKQAQLDGQILPEGEHMGEQK